MGRGVQLLLLACLCAASPASAISFTRVVDTTTAVPGGGFFDGGVAGARLSGSHVAFRGFSGGVAGLYVSHGGTLTKIVDEDTATPIDPSVDFDSFPNHVNDGGVVFFSGVVPVGQGVKHYVYSGSGGALTTVADLTVPLPGGLGGARFATVGSAEGGVTAISASGNAGFFVSYTTDGTTTNVIAFHGDPVPDGSGDTFTGVGAAYLDDSGLAFGARNQDSKKRIYTDAGGTLREVADNDTLIPGGHGVFASLPDPQIDDGIVYFQGGNGVDYEGIFQDDASVLSALVDSDDSIPGTATTFDEFMDMALVGDGIAFTAHDSTDTIRGLYFLDDSGIQPLLVAGDMLDGVAVSGVGLGTHGASDNDLAFAVTFMDGTSAIYTATVPEPGAAGLVADRARASRAATPPIRGSEGSMGYLSACGLAVWIAHRPRGTRADLC